VNASEPSWRADLVSAVLRSIRLRSSVYFRPVLRAPWGFSLASKGAAFHIVARGRCQIDVDGAVTDLGPGDFVVLPRGTLHVMRDSPGTPAINFFDLVRSTSPGSDGSLHIGVSGRSTALICGGMQFLSPVTEPLLPALPRLLHVKGRRRLGPGWLDTAAAQLLEETRLGRLGAEVIVTRLADLLFIHAVRTYLEENMDRAASGWLAALSDPQVGRALSLLHAEPRRAWSVTELAERVAASRSVFAAKFTRLVNETPLRYLTRRRLNDAASCLTWSDDSVKRIAAGAGYRSAAAFSRAFKRHMGTSPEQYRLAQRRSA
jgi:AraC-like DNA-binding protein